MHLNTTAPSAIGRSTTCLFRDPGNCTWTRTNGWTTNWWSPFRRYPSNPNLQAISCPAICVLRHGGMSPTWHLRLFRTGVGRCENRKYDQHFLLKDGTTGQLRGAMIDDIRMPLTEWIERHNRWADGEVAELANPENAGRVEPDAHGNPVERKRYLRQKYDRMPLFIRPFALFLYRYFVRLGFLDGTEGLIFWVLQTFWFRFLVDAKIWESRHAGMTAAKTKQSS